MTPPLPWQQLTHRQLYDAVHSGPGPGASMAAEGMWRRVAEIVAAGEERMDAAVRRSDDGWQGSTGETVRSGLHGLNSWARDAATDALNTTTAMGEQGVAAGLLRSGLDVPNTEDLVAAREFGSTNIESPEAFVWQNRAEEEARMREENARRAMEIYHFHSADNRRLMDYWTTPPTVVVEPAAATGAAGPGTAAPGSGGSAAGGSGGALAPGSGGAAGAVLPVGAGVPSPPGPGSVRPAELRPAGIWPGGTATGNGTGGAGARPGDPRAGGPGSSGAGAGVAGTPGGGAGGAPGRPGAAMGSGGGPVRYPSGGRGAGAGTRPTGSWPGSTGPGGPAVTGRDALPPGAGGRGPRVEPSAPAPRIPSPTWRDLVAAQRPDGGTVGRAPDGAAAGRLPAAPGLLGGTGSGGTGSGGAGSGGTGQADGRSGRGAGPAGGGLYPPMGAAGAGAQADGRRRPSFLIDDSGVFDVDVPCTEPVIRGTDPAHR